ncbi:uncharacterized protein LOC122503232 [Leptopilina heterotoma]|uniref:uncharacterized protein LOC122503231 n=1 Tax=Leptopilina heterotoma TaxID=63436 RepID=UPI001CA9604F|nr:uncharacterized protein LOC122503231 [Leptopilina heterotoma]XP_043469636.1 uncharacterized protein LOC122503232 [Leptopilina heterotoma]
MAEIFGLGLIDPIVLSAIPNIIFADDDAEEILIAMTKEVHEKIRGYFEEIIPRYSISDFKSHFRMTRRTFQNLLETLAPSLIDWRNAEQTTDPEKQLCIAVWLLCNLEVYRYDLLIY